LCHKAKYNSHTVICISYLQVTFRSIYQLFEEPRQCLYTWYSNKTVFVICGDVNVNYLENCKKRQQLNALLQTYNLVGKVSFPTRKTNASITAIDNVFITRTKNYTMYPHISGLSDQEAQIIVIENTVLTKQISPQRGTSVTKVYWHFSYY